jgi:RND family efflux transporter MFP subunit
MRARYLLPLLLPLLLIACNKPATDNKDAANQTLLLAAEDLLTVQTNSLALGPAITGTVQPARRADLRAEVSTVVMQVLKENGDPVKRGELLVRLDETAIRDSQTSANESVRAATQSLEQTERQLQRLTKLRESGMASTQQLEDTETRRNNATSELAAAKSRQAQARQQMLRTEVRAPFDGIVSDRKASVGDTAQIGKELLKVIDPGSMRFEGFVSADMVGQLRSEQAVSFRINGYGDTEFSGTIMRISPAANPLTRQVEVLVGINQHPAHKTRPLLSGLYAEGRIIAGGNAVTLPGASVQREGDKVYAWRVAGTELKKVALMLGPRDPRRGEYVVREGLTAGDQILRVPSASLRDGQHVELARPAAVTSPEK